MKNQYFGDVNDYRKYSWLRGLDPDNQLHMGVCWMMTPNDDTDHGNRLGYLEEPDTYRQVDPELFDWLREVVINQGDRRTKRMEESGLLANTVFHSEMLSDDVQQRVGYFNHMTESFHKLDLVFFDPDNGFEVASTPRGHQGSNKFLYWDECADTFAAGISVAVYQHFPMYQQREDFIERVSQQLMDVTGAGIIFLYRTPHVLFLLAAQERHVRQFRLNFGNVKEREHNPDDFETLMLLHIPDNYDDEPDH